MLIDCVRSFFSVFSRFAVDYRFKIAVLVGESVSVCVCSVHSFAQAFAGCGFIVEYLCVISQMNFIHAIAVVRKLYTLFILMIFPSIRFFFSSSSFFVRSFAPDSLGKVKIKRNKTASNEEKKIYAHTDKIAFRKPSSSTMKLVLRGSYETMIIINV